MIRLEAPLPSWLVTRIKALTEGEGYCFRRNPMKVRPSIKRMYCGAIFIRLATNLASASAAGTTYAYGHDVGA